MLFGQVFQSVYNMAADVLSYKLAFDVGIVADAEDGV